jgi:hypothetical protein
MQPAKIWKDNSPCANYRILHMAEQLCATVADGSCLELHLILIRRLLSSVVPLVTGREHARLIAFQGASSGATRSDSRQANLTPKSLGGGEAIR